MSGAHHYFSKTLKGFGIALILLSTGCTTSGLDTFALKFSGNQKPSNDTRTAKKSSIDRLLAKSAASPKRQDSREAVSTSNAFLPQKSSNPKTRNSAWCRYLDANARAQTAILRSPTVAGDINDEGNGGVSVSFDFVDLARANLKEETAQLRCRRFLVSNRLARLMLVAPQSLTLAGNRAKANYLSGKRGQLTAIKRKVKSHIASGEMTIQIGTALIQHTEQVIATEHHARAEALRREAIGSLEPNSTRGLNSELENSERLLQEIDRRSRSFEALKVSLSAGYGYQGDSGISANSGYGKFKLSYRLGAISPVRHEYEDIAAQARLDALHETNSGVLWRASEMSRAVTRARGGLLAQRKQLVHAIAQARSNSQLNVQGYEVEMLQLRYRAKVSAIAFEAELRGIDATLKDMRRVERNLSFR